MALTKPIPLSSADDWQARAAIKREQCLSAIPLAWRLNPALLGSLQTPLRCHLNNVTDIPRTCGLLNKQELQITEEYDVAALIAALAIGELSSTVVTNAFSKRAAIAQQLTNCITEVYFAEADKRAQDLDAMRESGRLAGPLHGLPVSLKDSFQLVGSQATIGLAAYLSHTCEANSALVDLLTGLGAVIYCKTNVPQTMMSTDTHNNVFGRTLNPLNTSLGAGGSSGGEGALVAMRGSPLGVGTDVGGSIRIPALCCGTYGFRPTADRVPYGGQQSCSTPGITPATILPCAGPLASDVHGLEVFMKAVLEARPWLYDSTAIDVPWRDVSARFRGKKLRLGVVGEDPIFPLHPPVRNAVADAVSLVQAAGHETLLLSAEECRTAQAVQVSWLLLTLDDRASRMVSDTGEDIIPSRKRILAKLEQVTDWSFVADVPESGLERLAALNMKREEIRDSWRGLWSKHGLDAVIGPSAQSTAVEHDEFGIPAYSMPLNLLDYPACVIPFGKADAFTADKHFEVQPGQSAPRYDPVNISRAPCSIQVFTSTMRDEECLRAAKLVDACLNKKA